ncbi:hypothetical protein NX059_009231 [Plenodomus lindquistii]|nr:hypothetical protein NX059_009231 [Plenodomus lindquistii]
MIFSGPHQARPAWSAQSNQQPQIQQPGAHYPQVAQPPSSSDPHFGYYGQVGYSQPYMATTSPVPFIAELPAPLPPAPPTVTPGEQLRQDELFAHRLQRLEVADARRKSSSALSFEHQRPGNSKFTTGSGDASYFVQATPSQPKSHIIRPAVRVNRPEKTFLNGSSKLSIVPRTASAGTISATMVGTPYRIDIVRFSRC